MFVKGLNKEDTDLIFEGYRLIPNPNYESDSSDENFSDENTDEYVLI